MAFRKLCLILAAMALVVVFVGFLVDAETAWRPAAALTAAALAVGLGALPALRGYQFTAWIVAAVVVAMLFPQLLMPLNPDDPKTPRNKWIMLGIIQIVMFGMGTQMSLADFAALGR